MTDKHQRLYRIIMKYREELQKRITEREQEMKADNNDHYMIYNALGFSDEEGYHIDYQHNVGRFLYKYSGSLIEDLAFACLKMVHPDAEGKVKIRNTIDDSPKSFEIDCLIGKKAMEIKWKDATTDGDHVKKENKRVMAIKNAGYIPIRLMFFEPNRDNAIRNQAKLKKLYEEMGGEYYSGQEAWDFIKNDTGIDLRKLLEDAGRDRDGE